MDKTPNGVSDDSDYIDIEAVAKILGKSQAMIYKETQAGNIPYELPPGKKIGMRFPREAIEVIAKRQRMERSQRNVLHLRFVPSTTADVWQAVKHARQIYGPEDSIGFERALEWRYVNPDISMSVKQEKQLAGISTFLPLEEDVIQALERDMLREREIPPSAIRQWSDPDISVYVAGLTVIPSGEPRIDRRRGSFLIAHTIKWAIMLSAEASVKNWYSIGVTEEGQRLLESLGFREILSLEGGERKGYILDDMLSNPAKLAQRFLQRMEHS